MLKIIFLVAFLSLTFFALTSKIDHFRDPAWSHKGWPVTYKSTFDESSVKPGYVFPALCLGADSLVRFSTCHVPGEFNDPFKLIYDFLFWLIVAVLLVIGFERFFKKH
jgi:hypothetical protein